MRRRVWPALLRCSYSDDSDDVTYRALEARVRDFRVDDAVGSYHNQIMLDVRRSFHFDTCRGWSDRARWVRCWGSHAVHVANGGDAAEHCRAAHTHDLGAVMLIVFSELQESQSVHYFQAGI